MTDTVIDIWTDENYNSFVREKNNRVLIADAVLFSEKKEFGWLWGFLADAYKDKPDFAYDRVEWAELRRKAWAPENRQHLLAWVKKLDEHYKRWQKFHTDYPKFPPHWDKIFKFVIKNKIIETNEI